MTDVGGIDLGLALAPNGRRAARPAGAGARGVLVGAALVAALLLAALGAAVANSGKGFRVTAVETRQVEDIIEFSARIDYGFSEPALEALANGVPLTLNVHVQVRPADAWVWENSLVDRTLRFRLRYRPLAGRYVVARLPGEEGATYHSRDAALEALGDLRNLQLLRADRLDPARAYEIHIRAALDVEELPLPLRPRAYLSGDWKLASDWTKWPLVR